MIEQANDVTLPPAPKADGRSKEARERRRAAQEAQVTEQVRADAPQPRPEEIRTRTTRADTVKKERRRREGVDKSNNLKLGFRFTPDPNYEYRWINHGVDGQRITDLTVYDDWDRVTVEGEVTDDVGSATRRAVGKDASGPIYSYLCRKPKVLYEQDHRKLQERNDEMMRHIRQGKPPTDIGRALKTSDNVYGVDEISIKEARSGVVTPQ